MPVTRAYEETIEFIAAGTSSQGIADYRPSEEARARVVELLAHEKSGSLTSAESSELQSYLHLEHLMRLAKARARRHLAAE